MIGVQYIQTPLLFIYSIYRRPKTLHQLVVHYHFLDHVETGRNMQTIKNTYSCKPSGLNAIVV